MRVNVLIVEDSRVSREAFERKITSFPEYSVIASIENAANAEIACMSNKIDLPILASYIFFKYRLFNVILFLNEPSI